MCNLHRKCDTARLTFDEDDFLAFHQVRAIHGHLRVGDIHARLGVDSLGVAQNSLHFPRWGGVGLVDDNGIGGAEVDVARVWTGKQRTSNFHN